MKTCPTHSLWSVNPSAIDKRQMIVINCPPPLFFRVLPQIIECPGSCLTWAGFSPFPTVFAEAVYRLFFSNPGSVRMRNGVERIFQMRRSDFSAEKATVRNHIFKTQNISPLHEKHAFFCRTASRCQSQVQKRNRRSNGTQPPDFSAPPRRSEYRRAARAYLSGQAERDFPTVGVVRKEVSGGIKVIFPTYRILSHSDGFSAQFVREQAASPPLQIRVHRIKDTRNRRSSANFSNSLIKVRPKPEFRAIKTICTFNFPKYI